MRNENSYYNEAVDFYIEKPEQWVFFPTQWAINVRNITARSNESIMLIIQQANVPFVYMQKPLGRDDIAYPTAAATCRYFENPTSEQMEQLGRIQLQGFEKNFADFKLIRFSSSEILSGCPANYSKSTFSMKNESGDTFSCFSQTWSVFYNNMGYTIGLSGSSENMVEYEQDLNEITNSILIGKAGVNF